MKTCLKMLVSLCVVTALLTVCAGCGSSGDVSPFKWGMSENEFDNAKSENVTFMGTEFTYCSGSFGSNGLNAVTYMETFADEDEAWDAYSALNDQIEKKYNRKDEDYIFGNKTIEISSYVVEGSIRDIVGDVAGVPDRFLNSTTYILKTTVEYLKG